MGQKATKETIKDRSSDIQKELSRCINKLLLKEPFFAHTLSVTTRNVTDTVPTAAVAIHQEGIHLLVNPGFFMGELKTASQRIAVLKHEMLHLVLKTCSGF
jgi:hypothetical protein